MTKYTRLRARLGEGPGRYRFREPPAAADHQLALVHAPEYIQRVCLGQLTDLEQRTIGFPWSEGFVERARRSVGGTIAACRAALGERVSANLAGGTHHAQVDRGQGFCVFNDAAVAARVMQSEARVGRVVIIDCDVHQGNGTASILAGDPSVTTFSIHCQDNFPTRKAASDIDIGLPAGTGDAEYLRALAVGLERALAGAPVDLAIYLAGVDVYRNDRYGRLRLSKAGVAARDALVLERLGAARIPVALAMAGGYAAEIDDIVHLHATTVELARALWARCGSTWAEDPTSAAS